MDTRLEAIHRRAEEKYDPTNTKEIALACCRSCQEVFDCRWRRAQYRHGCLAERENWTKEKRHKRTQSQRRYTNETWEQMKVKQREKNKNARLKNNRHPCPRCGTMTPNKFNCHTCLEIFERQGDLDAIMIWNAGESRRVTMHRASHDWAY